MIRIRIKWIESDTISDVAEEVRGESVTLPDQCMSLSEIFRRFALGQNLETTEMRNPVYGDVMEDYEFDELHEMLPKKPVDQVYDPEGYEESSQRSESEQTSSVPQDGHGEEVPTGGPLASSSESEKAEPSAKKPADER